MIERLLYTTLEARQSIGVGETTFKSMLAKGEIESVKIGRLRRIPADALKDWVERQRDEAG